MYVCTDDVRSMYSTYIPAVQNRQTTSTVSTSSMSKDFSKPPQDPARIPLGVPYGFELARKPLGVF